MHPREDEGSLPIDRKGILAEIVKRTLKQLRDPALARVIKQSPEEALMFVPEVIPVEKPKRMASAQRVAARFQDTPNDLAKEVISFLKAKSTKTGGNFRTVDFEPGTIDAEPSRRQRLDAYGNDGEGWDEDAWESEYASPLRNEVEELLNRRFPGNDFIVDIEGKGFVFIQGDSLKNGI